MSTFAKNFTYEYKRMIVTIINRDKRLPLASLGIYYLLPAIAEKRFRVCIIDPAVVALECESQSNDLPFRFLGLRDIASITTYLRSLMVDKRDRFFLNLWIMDEKDEELDRLEQLAESLTFFKDRVHERRNLLLINEYQTQRNLSLPEGWSSLHNQHIAERLAKGEKKRPYQEMMLIVLALVEWVWHSKNRAANLDSLFQNASYQFHPDDYAGLELVFAQLSQERIAALLEEENNAALQEAATLHRDATDSFAFSDFISTLVGNDSMDTVNPSRTDTAEQEQERKSVVAGADPRSDHPDSGLLPLSEYAQAEFKEWTEFSAKVRENLVAIEQIATVRAAKAKSDLVFRNEGKLRELINKLTSCKLEQILPSIACVETELRKIIDEAAKPLDTLDTENQWQTVSSNFFRLKDFCKQEKISTQLWGYTVGSLYLMGILYFGPKIHSFLPLAPMLLPHWSTRPLLEVAYWLVFAFLPLMAALELYLRLDRKYKRHINSLTASVDRLWYCSTKELEKIQERQKLEMKISNLRKVRILLNKCQKALEDEAIVRKNKVTFFKGLAKSMHLTLGSGAAANTTRNDVFAEYTSPLHNKCEISLSADSTLKFYSGYIIKTDTSQNSAKFQFSMKSNPTQTGIKQ